MGYERDLHRYEFNIKICLSPDSSPVVDGPPNPPPHQGHNVKQMFEELEKTDAEFGTLLGKIQRNINMLSTSEWESFDNIFGVLLRFKQWYLKGCIDYHNKGNTPCSNNKQSYFCNDCAIYDLTPWRADWNLRCPTGNTMQYKE